MSKKVEDRLSNFYDISYDDLSKIAVLVKDNQLTDIRPQIKSASLRLTENCNSKCITCNHWQQNQAIEEHLTKEEWKNIILQLIGYGVTTLYFTGGEPLLYKDIFELISFAKQEGIKTIKLLTNGLLIDKYIKYIKDSRIDEIHISIDGIGKTNDFIRGISGHFKKVEEIMKKLNLSDTMKYINMTVLRENIDQYRELKKLANKYGYNLGINLPSTKAYYLKNIGLNYPSKEQIKIFLDTVNYEKEDEDYIYNYLTKEGLDTNQTCILALKIIYVGYKGDIYSACHELSPVGNLREERLEKILSNDKYQNRLKEMIKHNCPGCGCGYRENLIVSNKMSKF